MTVKGRQTEIPLDRLSSGNFDPSGATYWYGGREYDMSKAKRYLRVNVKAGTIEHSDTNAPESWTELDALAHARDEEA